MGFIITNHIRKRERAADCSQLVNSSRYLSSDWTGNPHLSTRPPPIPTLCHRNLSISIGSFNWNQFASVRVVCYRLFAILFSILFHFIWFDFIFQLFFRVPLWFPPLCSHWQFRLKSIRRLSIACVCCCAWLCGRFAHSFQWAESNLRYQFIIPFHRSPSLASVRTWAAFDASCRMILKPIHRFWMKLNETELFVSF